MNGEHFRAFLWLRWRLFVNQWSRGGTVNLVIMIILAVLAVPSVILIFITALMAGLFLPEAEATPAILMYVWDGVIAYFLMMWSIGLVMELRRTEALAPEKFLHLPVSLTSVFVLNFVSSLFCLSLAVFVPMMGGLAIGLVFSSAWAMVLILLLLPAFFLMVTAVTYQFQGWLASLMVNKRRRRTIIVVVTMVFVLLCQLPNLVNVYQPWKEQIKLTREQRQENWQQVEEAVWLVNLVLPPGWLALGVKGAAEDDVLVPGLAILGMTLIGGASLWRAYRTTLRLHTGAFTAGKKEATRAPPPQKGAPGVRPGANLLEKQLPWLPEQVAVIALGSFRSLLRAPEAKMMLLSPVILLVVFAGLFMQSSQAMPAWTHPLLGYGAIIMVLFTLDQVLGNQFGFDRNGFRVFVLCPAPRKYILLGKNLAVVPLALALCLGPVILVRLFFPVSWEYSLALLPQFVSMYLLYCLQANWLSILIPLQIPSGSLKPANMKLSAVLLRTILVLLLPLILSPTLLPMGIDLALSELEWVPGGPVCLILAVLECAVIIWLYRLVLGWQGNVLQAREQKILDIVTSKVE